MKPAKSKRRVLTAREKTMRNRYTRLAKYTAGYVVYLQVGVQGFEINSFRQRKSEAEWTRDMLAIAISRIEL